MWMALSTELTNWFCMFDWTDLILSVLLLYFRAINAAQRPHQLKRNGKHCKLNIRKNEKIVIITMDLYLRIFDKDLVQCIWFILCTLYIVHIFIYINKSLFWKYFNHSIKHRPNNSYVYLGCMEKRLIIKKSKVEWNPWENLYARTIKYPISGIASVDQITNQWESWNQDWIRGSICYCFLWVYIWHKTII